MKEQYTVAPRIVFGLAVCLPTVLKASNGFIPSCMTNSQLLQSNFIFWDKSIFIYFTPTEKYAKNFLFFTSFYLSSLEKIELLLLRGFLLMQQCDSCVDLAHNYDKKHAKILFKIIMVLY